MVIIKFKFATDGFKLGVGCRVPIDSILYWTCTYIYVVCYLD